MVAPMSDSPPGAPPSPSGTDPARLARAKEIFLAVRELGAAARDDAVEHMCGADIALREVVRNLLRGADAPLPFETLAEDIRAAHHTRIGGAGTIDTGSLGVGDGGGGGGGGGEPRGDRIGNYRLLERIGEGGFGIVYMAEQERPVRRRVALKIIKLGMDTRQVVARFEAERQALAMMDHPNIARVFDAGTTPMGRPYFVMELVRGLPITEYCDQRKLPIRDRLALVAQVCSALQHAHSKGVIHRDIKPSNVLVSTIGDAPAPKIIDFGIAKATTARLTEKTVFTEFRQMIGTPEYMSPEQAGESNEDVDTRTDVYAVGVLLYELLTGATPFDSQRLRSAAFGEMQRIIREEDPPKPSTRVSSRSETLPTVAERRAVAPARLPPMIRGELDWIVMKALEKDRTRRYATAEAFGADLQRYLAGHAVEAAPPGAVYRVRTFVRRNRGPVIAASLLAAMLVLGLIGTSLGFVRAEQKRGEAVRERIRADAKTEEAVAAETIATRRAYSANLMSASAAINAVQFGTARSFLDAAPEHLRGWEWRVLHAELDTSVRSMSITPPTGDTNTSEFFHLTMHPDGESFFSIEWGSPTPARRWDLATGRELGSFPAPAEGLSDALTHTKFTVSPDGRALGAACFARDWNSDLVAIGAWDLSTGERTLRATVRWPGASIREGVVAGDGSSAFVFARTGFRRYDVRSGTVTAHVGSGDHGLLSLSDDESLIAGYDLRLGDIVVWDACTLVPIATFRGHGPSVYLPAGAFSDDNRWLCTGGDDDKARVWSIDAHPATHDPEVVLPHHARVTGVAFSPDGTHVATIARDRAIRIWERASGSLLGTYVSERLVSGPMMFLPDGVTIAGWEADGTVRMWDTTAERTTILRGHADIVSRAMFVPENPLGLIVSTGWDGGVGETGTVRVWDADSGDPVGASRSRMGDIVLHASCSADGRFAAFASIDAQGPTSRIEVLDLTAGRPMLSINLDRTPIFLAFARDRDGVSDLVFADARSVQNDKVQLARINSRTGATLASVELDPKARWQFRMSPDGRTIAAIPVTPNGVSAGRSGTMLLLDARSLATVRELRGIDGHVLSIAFSPDGARIATGSVEGLVRVYALESGALLATLSGHDVEVLAVEFSPDGQRIASAGLDRQIRIWDATTYDRLAAFGGHNGHIGDLEWDGGGERLVSCSGDSTVRIWEPQPIRTRVQARDARHAALEVVRPKVENWFTEFTNAERVIERINADDSLSPLEHKVALQEVLRIGLERIPTPAPAP